MARGAASLVVERLSSDVLDGVSEIIRTACSRCSGEYLVDHPVMTPSRHEMESTETQG